MRKAVGALGLVLVAAGCSGHSTATSTGTRTTTRPVQRRARTPLLVSPLGLPRVHSRVVPGYVLIADRNNNRVLLVSPSKKVVWQDATLRGPDDAFFTPGYRSVITNEEFNDTLVELSLKAHARLWQYGHSGVAGSSPGYLNTPDDAYRLPSGITTVADIQNCRIVQLSRAGQVARVLGGSCVHDPPRGFASPNGDTPLPDGGLLVTEIGGWIDRLRADGSLALVDPLAGAVSLGRAAAAGRPRARRVVLDPRPDRDRRPRRPRHLVVRLCKRARPAREAVARCALAERPDRGQRRLQPSRDRDRPEDQADRLAVRAHGRLRLRPRLSEQAGRARPAARRPTSCVPRPVRPSSPRRPCTSSASARCPSRFRSSSAVALPGGRVLVLGGLVGGSSSTQVLLGSPGQLRAVGGLPVPTHDAAAALVGGSVYLFGGGEAVSTDAVVRVDPGWRTATRARQPRGAAFRPRRRDRSAAARTSSAATPARATRRRSFVSGPARSRSW